MFESALSTRRSRSSLGRHAAALALAAVAHAGLVAALLHDAGGGR